MQFPELLGNTLSQWLLFVFLVALAVLFNRLLARLLEEFILKVFKKNLYISYGDVFKKYLSPSLRMLVVLIILGAAFGVLTFPSLFNITIFSISLQAILNRTYFTILLYSFFRVLIRTVDFISYILAERAKNTESKTDDQLVIFSRDVLKTLLFVSFLLILLGAVFGLNITSLLAGVGIGGLAVAFAAQESIKDLFGSVTVFLDKPFMVGDLVSIGDVQGVVEKVGIRSTRIRTSDKTFMTIPNKKMLESNVNNFTLRTYRRVTQTIGVSFESNPEALKKVLQEIRMFISEDPVLKDDEFTVTLHDFGESSMNILLEYFIPQMPYVDYLQQRERMNFKLLEILSGRGIKFAYPVRDVRLTNKTEAS